MKDKSGRIGSSHDDYLKEEGIYEEVTARAIKRVLVRQLDALMREASAAYDATAYARCLEVLGRVAEHAAPGAVPAEAERLRRTAEAALAREQEKDASRREANRRASQSATEMRDRAEHSRRAAEAALEPLLDRVASSDLTDLLAKPLSCRLRAL